MYVPEYALYVIIDMRVGVCLNALHITLLKWEFVCVWMRFMWFYLNQNWYVSECASYDIIKMRHFMCLNALYMIILKWELVCVWLRLICYY